MILHRRGNLAGIEFLNDFLGTNKPVIVTDAMKSWPLSTVWTGEYLARLFGDHWVQIYDDLFNLQDICSLEDYLRRYWWTSSDPQAMSVPYVRWYTRFKAIDFYWADSAFEALASYWERPYFLPDSDYLLPPCTPPKVTSPANSPFPAKGLFMSGRGARTRLHKDPWQSDAILCQMHGRKRVVMFRPEREPELVRSGEVIDIDNRHTGPAAVDPTLQPDFEDVLETGEVLFIPAGWYHHVDSLSNSISLTWNFVHAVHTERFRHYLRSAKTRAEMDVLSFFLPDLSTPG